MSSSSLTPRSSSSSSPKKRAAPNSSTRSSRMMITTTPRQSTTTTLTANNTFRTPQTTSPSRLVSTNMTSLHEDDNRLYLKSLELILRNNIKWSIKVGDLACVQIERPDCTPTNSNNTTAKEEKEEAPFQTTAYQPIQILSIYQERQVNKLSTKKKKKKKRYSEVKVEVRYFYRQSDLDESTRRLYGTTDGDNRQEELLESDRVEVVHASFLLGRLVLNTPQAFNNGTATSSSTVHENGKKNNNKFTSRSITTTTVSSNSDPSVPTVTMNYNHQFYLHQEHDVLQFNPIEDTLDALLVRGIKSSCIMAESEEVRLATCTYLNLTMMSDNSDGTNGNKDGVNEDIMEQVVVQLPPPTVTLQQKEDGGVSTSADKSSIHYYPSCQVQFTKTSPTIHPYESLPIHWNVCVGDVVAVQCHNDIPSPIQVDEERDGQGSSCNETRYPYRVPWVHAQITSIYRHVDAAATKSDGKNGTLTTTVLASEVQYDVRLFPRPSECLNECQDDPVVSNHLSNIPSVERSRTCEEIFEGNHAKVGLDFTTLLGPIRIVQHGEKLDDFRKSPSAAGAAAVTPFATQNRRTINSTIFCDELNQPKQLSPKNQAGDTDSDGIVIRGIEASRIWMSHDSQRIVYRDAVMQRRKERDDGVIMTIVDDDESAASIHFENSPDDCLSHNQAMSDPSPATAGARVDTASNGPATNTPKQRRSKRAKTPISKAETGSQSKKPRRSTRGEVATAEDDKHVSLTTATIRSLLDESPAATPATAPETRRSKRGKSPAAKAEPETKPKKQKQSASSQEEIMAPQNDELEDEVETLRVKCPRQPFHVDVSSQKSFYEEINIQPPIDSYDDRFSTNKTDDLEWWTVRLGDMVSIEVEHAQKVVGLVTFPFAVTWAPAEIVSIYRVHDNKAECLELREKLQSSDRHLILNDESFGDVMVEVRWFYRKHEIPGAGGKSSKPQSNDGEEELEELFETDQIDSCPAECLLSPIKLFEASRPEDSLPSVVSGMPCMYYHCRRYWSIHRKSFIPSGLLSNRIERGRMHSKYKAALSKLTSSSSNNGKKLSGGYSWKEGFQSAIQKLSLAEAAADVQVHGMELRCREKERRHIGSFLRKAIRGLEQPLNNSQDDDSASGGDEGLMNTKSSIFICGPPGTGKTASVRSIINELQEEQASGKLPEFNFIALNGMEMRSPFDSYVKFWEALSGTMKERLSAGAAAAKLEEFFGDGDNDNRNEDRSKKPITVLMLDEIDYLVTKKQTILYNFFDWPLRATSARLIVIGISNTINLPERLSMKLQSRLGGERCHFKSYTVDETVAILKTRLDGDASQVFDEDAIKFASRKTGNLSGDIRKAFQMCKVAAQNALDDYASGRRRIVEGSHPKVKISDVQRGSRDMYTSIIHKAISCSSSYEALVLIAIGALKKAKVGKDIVSLDVQEMLTKIESIANGSGEERYLSARLSLGDLLGILSRLGDAGILTLTTPKHSNHPWPLIQTSLEPYEINSSYRNTPHSKLAEKHLAEQRLF